MELEAGRAEVEPSPTSTPIHERGNKLKVLRSREKTAWRAVQRPLWNGRWKLSAGGGAREGRGLGGAGPGSSQGESPAHIP